MRHLHQQIISPDAVFWNCPSSSSFLPPSSISYLPPPDLLHMHPPRHLTSLPSSYTMPIARRSRYSHKTRAAPRVTRVAGTIGRVMCGPCVHWQHKGLVVSMAHFKCFETPNPKPQTPNREVSPVTWTVKLAPPLCLRGVGAQRIERTDNATSQ